MINNLYDSIVNLCNLSNIDMASKIVTTWINLTELENEGLMSKQINFIQVN